MRQKLLVILFIVLPGFLITRAWGDSITISNSDFQGLSGSVSSPKNFLGVTLIGSATNTYGLWTAIAGSSVVGLTPSKLSFGKYSTQGSPAPPEGNFDVAISLGAGLGNYDILSQTLNTTLRPNSTYTLSFAIDVSSSASLLSQSSLQLLAGSTTVASLNGTSLVSLYGNNSGFQTIDLTYQTGSTAPTGDIGIEFAAGSVLSLSGNIFLADAQLNVSSVPEPGSTSLIAMGFGIFMVINRFRKK